MSIPIMLCTPLPKYRRGQAGWSHISLRLLSGHSLESTHDRSTEEIHHRGVSGDIEAVHGEADAGRHAIDSTFVHASLDHLQLERPVVKNVGTTDERRDEHAERVSTPVRDRRKNERVGGHVRRHPVPTRALALRAVRHTFSDGMFNPTHPDLGAAVSDPDAGHAALRGSAQEDLEARDIFAGYS